MELLPENIPKLAYGSLYYTSLHMFQKTVLYDYTYQVLYIFYHKTKDISVTTDHLRHMSFKQM